MEQSLKTLLAFPIIPQPTSYTLKQYDDAANKHIELVKKLADKHLVAPANNGELPLDIVNPITHTISYARILQANIAFAKSGKDEVDTAVLWEKVLNFLRTFDQKQIRYIGAWFTQLLNYVHDVARSQRDLGAAIGPWRDALLRLDETGSVVTSNHFELVAMILRSRDYYEVDTPSLRNLPYQFLGQSNSKTKHLLCDVTLPPDIYFSSSPHLAGPLTGYQSIIEYCYNIGTAFLGIRSWDVAIDYLEIGIRYPCKDAVSKLQTECYKKWVLASVIQDGKIPTLPKATSSAAAKVYHVIAKPYEVLAQIFESGTAARLKAEADASQDWFRKDGNNGLVLQVLAAYQKHQIRNLADIYTKMTTAEVHNQTASGETGMKRPNVGSTEQLVSDMISAAELHATLTPVTGGPSILTFTQAPGTKSEAQVQTELLAATQRILAMGQEVRQTDHGLTHDKEYIKTVQKQRKLAKNGGAAADQPVDTNWNDMVDDEDIMGY